MYRQKENKNLYSAIGLVGQPCINTWTGRKSITRPVRQTSIHTPVHIQGQLGPNITFLGVCGR